MTSAHRNPPLRIVVLAGADTAEREVSLRSGTAVVTALREAGHQVTLVDPAETPLDQLAWNEFDACFLALHGGAGEDGRLQQVLETRGVPYTGCGPRACELAMSKSASKACFLTHGVPTLPYEVIACDDADSAVSARLTALGYPLIIKPDGQGSSVGIVVVEQPAQLSPALAEARQFDGTLLAEPLVQGREFTVAVLDEQTLPLLEIRTPERVFSYDAKYNSSLTETTFEIDLDDALQHAIREAALGAARALGTAGLVRVDLMLDHDARPWVLEVNTIPGMTPRSLAPQAAQRAGIEMPALCDLLVRRALAMARCP